MSKVKSYAGNRSFGLNTNGKGSADRSPGWRDNYHTISGFGTFIVGFVRKGGKQTKKYLRS